MPQDISIKNKIQILSPQYLRLYDSINSNYSIKIQLTICFVRLVVYINYKNITSMKLNLPKEVPLLPGYVFNDPYKQSFHKTQQFNFIDGSQQEKKQNVKEEIDENLIDQLQNSMSALTFLKERPPPLNDYIPRVQPPWLKYDRKVLRFYGFFKEHVVESQLQNYRIRKVSIYYYLSDETIFITEPKIENSGIPQGVFLKRQKVPKQIGELADHYTWPDLHVGSNINFFQRIFRICECDAFTRQFYQYMNQPQNQGEPIPDDSFDNFINVKEAKINPPDTKEYKEYIQVKLGGGHPNDGLRKYLENDRKVLSFKALWFDKELEGGYNYFTLNYYLADDNVEVKEVRYQNSGRDPFPLLLRKRKLPKVPAFTYYPGMSQTKQEFYSPNDFQIGKHINVFGRDCVIYSCDDFTRAYYRYNLGKELIPINVEEGQKKAIEHQIPPYTGYGSPEDSLGSVYSLQPKPPKKDMTKQFTNDQFVLRFEARLISQIRDQNDRKFILSFFCGDDTVQAYQNADKNSGIWGGKFLQRKKHDHPEEKRYLIDSDFQVGGMIKLGAYTFQLLKADDFTINYMRQRPHKFPEINLEKVVQKIRNISKTHTSYDNFLIWLVKNVDPKNKSYLNYDQFYSAISKFAQLTHTQAYIIFKQSKQNEKLSMKLFFKLLGGA